MHARARVYAIDEGSIPRYPLDSNYHTDKRGDHHLRNPNNPIDLWRSTVLRSKLDQQIYKKLEKFSMTRTLSFLLARTCAAHFGSTTRIGVSRSAAADQLQLPRRNGSLGSPNWPRTWCLDSDRRHIHSICNNIAGTVNHGAVDASSARTSDSETGTYELEKQQSNSFNTDTSAFTSRGSHKQFEVRFSDSAETALIQSLSQRASR